MNINLRLKPWRGRQALLALGLTTFLAIVTIGITMLPSFGTPTPETVVGDYPNGVSVLPTSAFITPTAAPGSTFEPLSTGLRADGSADANGAIATALSPDGKSLLVLTSGYNKNFFTEAGQLYTYPVLDPVTGATTTTTTSNAEWVFVYDVSSGNPVKKQQLNLPNTFAGIAWAPDGKRFYVSAGVDDRIYVYRLEGNTFVPDAPFILLNHNDNQTAPLPTYNGGLLKGTPASPVSTGAVVAGLGLSKDGRTLVAANFENDSISVVDTETRQVLQEIKFFEPGDTVATGEFPFGVTVASDRNGAATKAYITSQRDDEVLVVDLKTNGVSRIAVGAQPNSLLLSADQTRLYVANGNSDSVSVIDTKNNRVVRTISLARRGDPYKGANPNSLALSPDGKFLYVTLGGENAIAVVNQNGQVAGRIPTAWYPNSLSLATNGSRLFVVNLKDNAGPNPSGGRSTAAGIAQNTTFRNEYIMALQKAGISTIPVPDSRNLAALSRQVDRNNGFDQRGKRDPMMASLRGKIKHVLYIIKENRTYDQVLGDLPIGNGDPELTLFPEAISPNHHKLATDYVTLDNFYDSGSVSGDGWGWSTFGRTTDYTEKTVHVLYGNSGFSGLTYDYEGNNRFLFPSLPNSDSNPGPTTVRVTSILDPSGGSSILPGNTDMSAPAGNSDLSRNAKGGYIWDSALRAGKTVRVYGPLADLSDFYYVTSGDPFVPDPNNPLYIPISRTPFDDGIPQAPHSKTSLKGKTDTYFRGYDMKEPDIYAFEEWKRDLEAYIDDNGTLPNLMVMALPHDHFGSFSQAIEGLTTPETQMADNDYAFGLIVDYLSHRPEWRETAIVVLEDDAQNGPDHVDAHRSIAYIVSPYTKRGSLVSTLYSTVNVIRTIEDFLGIDYIGTTDANAKPMSDLLTRTPDLTPYEAIVPGILCQTPVNPGLVPECQSASVPKSVAVRSRHDGNWWANATRDFDFEAVDHLDADAFNRVLWSGIKGDDVPYPTERHGLDLRGDRAQRLATAQPG